MITVNQMAQLIYDNYNFSKRATTIVSCRDIKKNQRVLFKNDTELLKHIEDKLNDRFDIMSKDIPRYMRSVYRILDQEYFIIDDNAHAAESRLRRTATSADIFALNRKIDALTSLVETLITGIEE